MSRCAAAELNCVGWYLNTYIWWLTIAIWVTNKTSGGRESAGCMWNHDKINKVTATMIVLEGQQYYSFIAAFSNMNKCWMHRWLGIFFDFPYGKFMRSLNHQQINARTICAFNRFFFWFFCCLFVGSEQNIISNASYEIWNA